MEYSALHFFMLLNSAAGIKCKSIICRVWKAQCSARPRCTKPVLMAMKVTVKIKGWKNGIRNMSHRSPSDLATI